MGGPGDKNKIFDELVALPQDPVLGMAIAFKNDPNPNKVNLGIGSFRDDNGKPKVFDIVRQVEKDIAQDETLDKEYSPEDGIQALQPLAQKVQFGKADERICSVQCVGGTGCLHLSASFIKMKVAPDTPIYMSKPTWPNHHGVYKMAGFDIKEYPYWNQEKRKLDIPEMLQCLRDADDRSIVLLHACAHNPTGMDPTNDDWRAILDVVKSKKHIAVMDSAYQGFASGDLDRDAFAVRIFFESGIEFFVCQSFSKNMGLYGERLGVLHAVCADKRTAEVVKTHMKFIARRVVSNPPLHSGRVAVAILSNTKYNTMWMDELKVVATRITAMRKLLRDGLVASNAPGDWEHVVKQEGMFSYTGLSTDESKRMVNTWAVHMMLNGRISLAGINTGNVEYIVKAIVDSTTAPKA